MKPGNTTLTFLDLIFSLLGVTTILTVILSITVGRSDYRLKEDYVFVTVRWKAEGDLGRCRSDLFQGSTVRPWTYWQSPPPKSVTGGKAYESVFYAAPIRAGTWRIAFAATNASIESIHVETKRGSLPPITPLGSTADVSVDTAEES